MSGRRILVNAQRLVSRLLDPALCLGCGYQLESGDSFCPACAARLDYLVSPCSLCGLENPGADECCAACLYDPPRWQKLVAPLVYQGLARDLLLQLKFADRLQLATSLVSASIQHFSALKPWPEVLLPVPLHHDRLLDRGYNQAFEIARCLSQALDIPIDTQILQRIRCTESQSGLSANQRQKNLIKAFACLTPSPYTHVAVVDDIITTGSTANEITKTLHRAGVERVDIWGLARVCR